MATIRQTRYGLLFCVLASFATGQSNPQKQDLPLPSSKSLQLPARGAPQRTNSFPTAVALSPDGKYLAILNNGRGTAEAKFQQSIALLDQAQFFRCGRGGQQHPERNSVAGGEGQCCNAGFAAYGVCGRSATRSRLKYVADQESRLSRSEVPQRLKPTRFRRISGRPEGRPPSKMCVFKDVRQ